MYDAKVQASKLAEALGYVDRASQLRRQARSLKERFDEAFWCEESSTMLALDGHKRPCQVKTSNAGHCLYTGIATDEHARRGRDACMSDEVFSGWGSPDAGRFRTTVQSHVLPQRIDLAA